MHRFKTKDQSEKDDQLQGGHSNLAGMQLKWFLKSKSQLRVWLNNSKIDWFENKTFWCPFLLKWNSVFCSKRHHFHYSLKKKSYKRCRFDGTVCHRLPLYAQRFSFPSFAASLPLTCPKIPTQPTPPHGLPPWWKGQRRQALRVAAQRPTHPPYPFTMTAQG